MSAELPLAAMRLPESAQAALAELVRRLSSDPGAPSSVRDPSEAWRVHIADSLSGLDFDALGEARRIADVGAGAGLPGIPLAIALPHARVDLIEGSSRKCEFMRRTIEGCAIENAEVVCMRSEAWAESPPPVGGRDAYDAVTARAVGRLSTLAELASPLLRPAGVLVAWKGRRDEQEEAELERALDRVAMAWVEQRWVGPYAGSRNRHLHLFAKTAPTPDDLPRRPGVAKKRPFGSRSGSHRGDR